MKRFLVSTLESGGQLHSNKNSSSRTIIEDEILVVENNPVGNILNTANKLIFGNKSFRNMQEDIISAVMGATTDIFVVMPTGGGKSLCYALPAVLSKGVTVVVSPLTSLIEEQVSTFIQFGGGGIPAAYLTSSCTKAMVTAVFSDLARARKGKEPFLKLLYVTPERLVRDEVTRKLLNDLYQNEMLARIVIDEAHCVSSWGHDFRKDYGALGFIKTEFPEISILALTATASAKVSQDTIATLGMTDCLRFNAGFDRPNLFFEVRPKSPNPEEMMLEVLDYINSKYRGQTGIIYCMTKRQCEEAADFLRDKGMSADYYHAGMLQGDRRSVQAAWQMGKVQIVCATIAYGMGIDKPDVRFVIHLSLAKSLEGYYQEAGRAGRDGQSSECILFYRREDVSKLSQIMRMKKHKLSKKESEMLSEMQHYCEELEDCRRKTFSDKFGSPGSIHTSSSSSSSRAGASVSGRVSFTSCRSMCDNCVAAAKGESSRRGRFKIGEGGKKKKKDNANTKKRSLTMAASKAGDSGESTEVAVAKRPCFMKASDLAKSASATGTGTTSRGSSDIIEIDGDDNGWIDCRPNLRVTSSSSSSSSSAASNMQKNSADQSRLGRRDSSVASTPGSRAISNSGQDLKKIHSKTDTTSGSRRLPSTLFKHKI